MNGVSGLYTGEVNEFKTPYGMGSMRYDDGYIAEGEWRNGTMGMGMEPDRCNEQDQYDGDNVENDRRSSDGEETDEEQRSNFEKSLIIDDEGTLSYAA